MSGVFFIQTFIKATWEENINTLKVKKDILSNVLLRNYFVIDLAFTLIVQQSVNNGKFNPFLFDSEETIFFLQDDMASSQKANNILLQDTISLKEEMRERFFLKDIRVFEACSNCSQKPFIKVNNFQASNMIIESALGRAIILQNNGIGAFEGIDTFYENCLNDLALKNADIFGLFANSLDDQKDEILKSMNKFFVLTISLLVLNALFISLNIWKLYLSEKLNLTSILKLKAQGLKEFFGRLKTFQEMLENHGNFEQEHIDSLEHPNFQGISFLKELKQKNYGFKFLNTKRFNRKYHFYFIKLISLTFLLSRLAFWGTKTVQTLIDNISQKNSQLYFLSLVRSRIELFHTSVLDLIGNSNIDRRVENLPILTFLSNSVQEMRSFSSQIADIFPSDQIEKGSNIEQILYGNACEFLIEFVQIFCTILKEEYGITPNFVHSLIIYENFLTNFYLKYTQLNETERLLYRPEDKAINFVHSISIIGGGSCPFELLNRIDKAYEELLNDSKGQRNIIFGLFTCVFIVLIISFCIVALKDLKEIHNRFKRLLEVFPPYLILSNFYIKSFFIKNSKGALDFVKNEI